MRHFNFTPACPITLMWAAAWPAMLFWGCKATPDIFMKEATGHAGELVVVTAERYIQEPNPIMDSLKAWFTRPMRIMLQPEPLFKVFKIDNAHFGSVFKYHRNVLLLNIGAPADAPVLAMQDDKWARRQRVVQLNVPREEDFPKLFKEKREEIEALFYQKDMERLAQDFEKNKATEATACVEKATGIRLALPSGFFCAETTGTAAFVRHVAERSMPGGHKGTIERGLVVFSSPYDRISRFSVNSFLEDVAPFLKKMVHGAKDSTWMEVEPRVPCDSTAVSLAGRYGMRVRGLWRMHGEYKGGPFVGIRYFDEAEKKLLSAFGYVYAPNFSKRTYVFQVEAIARSLAGTKPTS